MAPVRLFLADAAATDRLAEGLALALKRGDCVGLSGDLGAGKTTLARALIRALAEDDDLEVPSPTFTLVQTYEGRIPVAHFDLYRLSDASELDELGLDEALADGLCLVEWPERAAERLPRDRITLSFTHRGDGRDLLVEGPEAALARIARSLAIRGFLDREGLSGARRCHLSGDASSRAYEHVIADGTPSRVLMDAPRLAPGPILEDGKYYQQIAHIAEDCRPFAAVSAGLRAAGLHAPAVLAADLDQGILLLEDLGAEGIVDAAGRPIVERYEAGIDLLARLHAAPFPRTLPLPDGTRHRIPDFDPKAMAIETSLLLDWYLPSMRGAPPTDAERQAYRAIWSALIAAAGTAETNLLLRDFHSPNILWQAGATGTDRVGLIDFQDAMIGPTAYDVASLTQDARIDMPPDLTASLVDRYIAARRENGPFDEAAFRRDWHLMAAQRNCKLAGIWVRLKERDGKSAYLRHLPRTLAYLKTALSHETLAPLRDWCAKAEIL
ncbi:tRNA (adenosine(37)-N6)-threonylcarbamoyltransferase complex ATPase subunit type 1 TsaE [Ensifer soli]|uniref:tRNA (adenosine(37)-N6)-threonylcarbamoyltransferase complex ATPase subunit type 1 TsaE n=1 Tax=Ciceribacter sp. sgz301302 TaxID=3342379 RepID=UPI0035B766AA